MVMLEAAYYYLDEKEAKQNFSTKLFEIEPRYGIALAYKKRPSANEFIIPCSQNTSGTLLALMFDVIRNGHAHEYETKPVNLNCGGTLEIGLTGADKNYCLHPPTAGERESTHLVQYKDSTEDCLILKVRSDILFLDFWKALKESGLYQNDSLAASSGLVRILDLNISDLKTRLRLSRSLLSNSHFR
jgi:hypothetical protein